MKVKMLKPYNGKGKINDIVDIPDIQAMALIRNKVATQYVETTAKKPTVKRKRQTAVKKNIETR